MLTAWTFVVGGGGDVWGGADGGVSSFNITKVNLLIRFSKTREICPSVTRILGILLTTTATSLSVQKTPLKECVA